MIPKEVEALVKKASPQVKALIVEARSVVLKHFPKATEQVKSGWGVIWYGSGPKMTEQVIALSPHSWHVNIEFALGTELPDPTGLLEGTGKRIRHVKVRSEADLKAKAVRDLIKTAVKSGPPDWPSLAASKRRAKPAH